MRDLGIYVDTELTWTTHIQITSSKAKQISAWILSVFYSRDRTTMLTLFKSLVRPILEYCSEIWSPHLIKDIYEIEKIQRSFTYRIKGVKELNYWERLKELKIMSLQRRRERNIIICLWKIKNGLSPNSINMEFKYNTRKVAIKAVLKPLPKIKGKVLTTYEESFVIRSAKLWNCLPAKLTFLTSLNVFKVSLDKFLLKLPDQPPIPGYVQNSKNSIVEQSLCLS